jgi:hypothetical protein
LLRARWLWCGALWRAPDEMIRPQNHSIQRINASDCIYALGYIHVERAA